jgi:LCP family protein required for cell wall assembly
LTVERAGTGDVQQLPAVSVGTGRQGLKRALLTNGHVPEELVPGVFWGNPYSGVVTHASSGGSRSRRPLVGAVLSSLLPGSGQLYRGERRRGAWLIGGSLAAVGLVVVMAFRDTSALLKLAFEPPVLIGLLFANAAVFVFRAYATVDAYRRPEPGTENGWLMRTAVPVLGLVLIVPHAWFAYYDVVHYDLITTVFTSPPPTTTTTTQGVPMAAHASTTTEHIPAVQDSNLVVGGANAAGGEVKGAEPAKPWGELDRLNILLLGSDAGVGRTGVRTDTMILASVAVATGDLTLISIPRNFARVPLPDGIDIWSCDCFPRILNELYQYGEDHPGEFPGPATPGANALKGAVSELVGLPVHFYALVALDGFVAMVDAVGGVTVNVTERVYDPAYPAEGGGTEVVDMQPGVHDFDGHQALAFARIRYSADDYDRMGRQRCVIEAVLEQADPFTLLRNYPRLAEAVKESVETDFPLDAMPDLIDLLSLVDTEAAVSLRLVPPTYVSGWTEDRYNIPDVELIREHAHVATSLSPLEAIRELGLEPLGEACS